MIGVTDQIRICSSFQQSPHFHRGSVPCFTENVLREKQLKQKCTFLVENFPFKCLYKLLKPKHSHSVLSFNTKGGQKFPAEHQRLEKPRPQGTGDIVRSAGQPAVDENPDAGGRENQEICSALTSSCSQ